MLREVLNLAASGVDAAVGVALLHPLAHGRGPTSTTVLGHEERIRLLAELAHIYDRPEHYEERGGFFGTPARIDPRLSRVRRLWGGDVLDATWPSEFEPHCAEVASRYLEHASNQTAAARLFLHRGEPRPCVLLIHGYRCGHFAVEERVWPIEWLYERGLDVALVVLPFHAVRARRGSPLFPSTDPWITAEGFRQAIHDLRSLLHFLMARGSRAVGAMGMSLGGYTSSLLATIEEKLAFAVPLIPVASLADCARANGYMSGNARQQEEQCAALERALFAVSPFARKPRVPGDRVLVLAASGDRITPVEHARRLATHFQAPLKVFPGGHLLQFGRAEGFREVGRMLERLEIFHGAPRPLVRVTEWAQTLWERAG